MYVSLNVTIFATLSSSRNFVNHILNWQVSTCRFSGLSRRKSTAFTSWRVLASRPRVEAGSELARLHPKSEFKALPNESQQNQRSYEKPTAAIETAIPTVQRKVYKQFFFLKIFSLPLRQPRVQLPRSWKPLSHDHFF
jgi:hypothetical protein